MPVLSKARERPLAVRGCKTITGASIAHGSYMPVSQAWPITWARREKILPLVGQKL
ncbi:MAG: hypothetical protein LBH14_08345 [Desulfobulbaceae bacterium]|jgi:hypothetical protein|nr:hypothetical protein [Desulfobulbaceae bacterium]